MSLVLNNLSVNEWSPTGSQSVQRLMCFSLFVWSVLTDDCPFVFIQVSCVCVYCFTCFNLDFCFCFNRRLLIRGIARFTLSLLNYV